MRTLAPLTPMEIMNLRTRALAQLSTGRATVVLPVGEARRILTGAPDVFYQADPWTLTQAATTDDEEIALEGRTLHAALNVITYQAVSQAGPWSEIVTLCDQTSKLLAGRAEAAPEMAPPGDFTERRPDMSGSRPRA